MNAHWIPGETPLVILAEGCFGETQSKTALGVIRYGDWPISAVIDSTQAGKTVRDITGMPCEAPIIGTVQEALQQGPKALLLGTAPPGGQLPESWRQIITEAIQNSLHVINGLHTLLNEDPEFVQLAKKHQVKLWDVRDPRYYGAERFETINLQKPRPENVQVVTMVGTDCAIGKMYTALELNAGMKKRGAPTEFLATGQTGIMISGTGVPLDRVIGDFMAGGVETCVLEAIEKLKHSDQENPLQNRAAQDNITPNSGTKWIFVEGQGCLMHPAYSGVTLSLLHGSNPNAMILCHKAGLTGIRNYHLPLPALKDVIAMYEQAAGWVRSSDAATARKAPARIVGISVNTSAVSEAEAHDLIARIEQETGLPATDPIRYGVDCLLNALEKSTKKLGLLKSS